VIAGQEWVLSLPDHLAAQRALLLRLLEEAKADDRWRFVELCCSLVRGNADELSDVDAALGAASGEWAETIDAAFDLLGRLGPVIDVLQHELGWAGPHRRFFVQYDAVQLDLVVFPRAEPGGPSAWRGCTDGQRRRSRAAI
jgi:predicted nucleotidyltransferase